MSCHGMSAWVVFWLGHLAISDRKNLQVCLHDDIDGSSLARAIYASTGPLLFPLIQGFSHTHTILQKNNAFWEKVGCPILRKIQRELYIVPDNHLEHQMFSKILDSHP